MSSVNEICDSYTMFLAAWQVRAWTGVWWILGALDVMAVQLTVYGKRHNQKPNDRRGLAFETTVNFAKSSTMILNNKVDRYITSAARPDGYAIDEPLF